MVYLNSTPAQHEAVFRATSQAGLRYLRMDFAVGLAYVTGSSATSPTPARSSARRPPTRAGRG